MTPDFLKIRLHYGFTAGRWEFHPPGSPTFLALSHFQRQVKHEELGEDGRRNRHSWIAQHHLVTAAHL
jgi:hypothetical protein